MCIRDRWVQVVFVQESAERAWRNEQSGHDRDECGAGLHHVCLLYTSDAADERSSVDLGGRRINKKKKQNNTTKK